MMLSYRTVLLHLIRYSTPRGRFSPSEDGSVGGATNETKEALALALVLAAIQ